MNTKLHITLLVLFAVILSTGLVFAGYNLLDKYIPTTTGEITTEGLMTTHLPLQKDYPFNVSILEDIERIAGENTIGKTYKIGVYDCTQYSEDLVFKLKMMGYKAQCTAGHVPNWSYKNHTWVSVWVDGYRIEVEATGGWIIDPEEYKQDYVPLWEGFCW